MRGRIVRVGNSRGLRLPAPLLAQTGLQGDVEIETDGNTLRIRPARKPRDGWEEAFAAMTRRREDSPLDLTLSAGNRFDDEEWEWR